MPLDDAMPKNGVVRRRMHQLLQDAERVLRLEESGFTTETIEFIAPTVTPHNLLLRGRAGSSQRRRDDAQQRRTRLSIRTRM
jgi:hypothetical protein